MEKPKLFFGTSNPNKLREINEILGERFTLLSFQDLAEPMDVEETEATLEANALLKAEAYYAVTGIPCFADDSGLEIKALGGRPGVYSARYAGEPSVPANNIQKVLTELEGVEDRSANFRTVIAWYDGHQVRTFEGRLEGHIGLKPVGTNGFGYDPIFYPQGSDRSLAEYTPEEKNRISHRSRALQQFVEFLS